MNSDIYVYYGKIYFFWRLCVKIDRGVLNGEFG